MREDPRVAEAHKANILDIAQRLGAVLKKQGVAEHAGACPRCGGTDRFAVNTVKNSFICRGSGANPKGGDGGDAILMVQHAQGVDFDGALEFITGKERERSEKREPRAARAASETQAPPPWEEDIPMADEGAGRPSNRAAKLEVDLEKAALWGAPAKIYDYRDEVGFLVYQKLRFEWIGLDGKKAKTFRQRRPARASDDPGKVRDGFVWKLPGEGERVPYRLAEVMDAVAAGETIWCVEGEKDADTVASFGLTATCTDMGAGQWPPELNQYFVGADMVILQDNDPQQTDKEGKPRFHPDGRPVIPGKDHTQAIGRALAPYAKRIRVLTFPETPTKGDVSDWAAMVGGDAEKLVDKLAAEGKPWARERPGTKYGALTWEQLDDAGPEIEWLIRDFITVGDRSIVGGESGSGKTFFSIHAAMCIATNREFFGRKVRPGLVVYQAGESAKGAKKRLRAWRTHYGLAKDAHVPIVLLSKRIDLFREDADTKPMIEEIKAWQAYYPDDPLRLVVIDTLAKASIGIDENSSRDTGIVLENAAKIEDATGAHVMLVHHMSADGKKLRGSTAIYANIDNVISITADEAKVRTAVVVKQKEGDAGKSARFELAQIGLGYNDDAGQEVSSCVALAYGEKEELKRKEDRDGIKVNGRTELAFRALLKAINLHSEEPPEGLSVPPGVRVVRYKAWETEYIKIASHASDDATKQYNAARELLRKAGEYLLSRGAIGRDNPFIWLAGREVQGFPETRPPRAQGNVVPFRRGPADDADLQGIGDLL